MGNHNFEYKQQLIPFNLKSYFVASIIKKNRSMFAIDFYQDFGAFLNHNCAVFFKS